MRTLLVIVLGIMISISGHSQGLIGYYIPKAKGMAFCPQGSYEKVKLQNGDSIKSSISVSPFWISNEITNKEYREFYMDIQQTPADTIYWIDYEKLRSDSKTLTRKNINTYLKRISHSELLSHLINNSVWDPDTDKKDYFSNSKYNNYPVLGVSYTGAMFYCIWRTNRENDLHESKNEPLITNYRVPLETEWEYAATFFNKTGSEKKSKLHSVKRGEKNDIGVCNLRGNVSEWTSSKETSDDNKTQVVRGGSWKSYPDTELRELQCPDSASDYIGFRIVRSFPSEN